MSTSRSLHIKPQRAAPLVLVLCCLAVYLPGMLALPVVDRDEARFAQASRQMFEAVALPAEERSETLHRGGLVMPMLADTPRLNKGPVIYWLQASSAALFTAGDPSRDAIWMYRVPSLLAAIGTVLLTRRIGVLFFHPSAATLAAAMLAIASIFAWETAQARSDHVLVFFTTLAMHQLAIMWKRPTPTATTTRNPIPRHTALLGLAIAAGLLTKGPITPMVCVATVAAIALTTRRFRWLGWRACAAVIAIAAVAATAWIIPLAGRFDLPAYFSLLFDETVVRAAQSREGHAGPPGYHTVLLAALFWPGSLLTTAAFFHAIAKARGPNRPRWHRWRGRRAEIFLLAWIVPAWLIFEFTSTKLPHYTLPLYPPIALLTARYTLKVAAQSQHAFRSIGDRIGVVIWLALGLALCVALPLLTLSLEPIKHAALATVIAALLTASLVISAAVRIRVGRPLAALAAAIAAAAITIPTLNALAAPSAGRLWISQRIIASLPAGTPRPIAAVEYHEDSLVFLTRARLQRIDDPQSWAAANPTGILILPENQAAKILNAFPAATTLGTVQGFNYSRGSTAELSVLSLAP